MAAFTFKHLQSTILYFRYIFFNQYKIHFGFFHKKQINSAVSQKQKNILFK